MKILITGASGFIGKKLVRFLLGKKISVRVMSRNLESLDNLEHNNLEKIKADAQDYKQVLKALEGIDVVYYLIHSMEGESKDWERFVDLDKRIAKNFADASTECNVKRIIYVGGLVSIPDNEMSKHMSSRQEVGEILKTSKAKVTVFRASVILGKGGGGFEMMRYLVERLPIMVCPKWVLTKLQPIYIDDVVRYLYESLNVKETEARTFDIGGPDILEYREMMKKYATGKYDPEEMSPLEIINSVKKAGIRAKSSFLIGFRDQSWESILETKEFAKELIAVGLDQVAFAVPVPYPGTLDFEYEMSKPDVRKDFNENLLEYTDNMHVRGRPLFHTKVPAENLSSAVKDFWKELNSPEYVSLTSSQNVTSNIPDTPYEHN